MSWARYFRMGRKQHWVMGRFDKGASWTLRNSIAYRIIAAGIAVGRVHQIIFTIMFQHKWTFVPLPFRTRTQFPCLLRLRDEEWFAFQGNQIVIEFGNVEMAFMSALHNILTAIARKVKVFMSIVIQ